MNCNDVERLLNEHRLSALSPAERREFDAHLADCGRCFTDVSAERILLSTPPERPPADLLQSILNGLPEDDAAVAQPGAPFGWQVAGGLAAMAAVAVLFVFATMVREPGISSDASRMGEAVSNVPASGVLSARPFVEGEDFVALPVAGRFADLGDQISAWIYFMWSCLHCYELESALSEWVAQLDPRAVDVTMVPVVWNDYAELHARAFYAESILGVSEPVSDAFFEAIHENGDYLDTREAIQAVFLGLGVDRGNFDAAFDSERVDDLLRLARFSAAEAQVDATPTMVVGGIYKTSPAMAGSQERMLEVADWLIEGLRLDAAQASRCALDRERASGCQ